MSSALPPLDSIFKELDDQLHALKMPAEPASLYDPIRYTLEDTGKRIRPKLVVLGTALTGGDLHRAIPAGIGMELLHNFTLIHDDIMDNADMRRGKASVYKKWGVPIAILSGDMTFGLAYQQFQSYADYDNITKKQFAKILGLFHQAVKEVCEGQAYDIEFETKLHVDIDSYLEMIRLKTAALLSSSLAIGGVLSGASDDEINHLQSMGNELGLAFQIQDDLLDVIADPKKFGKKVGGDIKEGKKTFLMIHALERAKGADLNQLTSIVQSKSATDVQIFDVVRLYQELGILELASSEIDSRYAKAMNHLGVFVDTPYYSTAKNMFDALIQRDK
jgi:geranylgeranyl diphosphate synthase, type II